MDQSSAFRIKPAVLPYSVASSWEIWRYFVLYSKQCIYKIIFIWLRIYPVVSLFVTNCGCGATSQRFITVSLGAMCWPDLQIIGQILEMQDCVEYPSGEAFQCTRSPGYAFEKIWPHRIPNDDCIPGKDTSRLVGDGCIGHEEWNVLRYVAGCMYGFKFHMTNLKYAVTSHQLMLVGKQVKISWILIYTSRQVKLGADSCSQLTSAG